jgi:hypothetical protein
MVDLIMLSTLRLHSVDNVWANRNVEYGGKDIDRGRLKYWVGVKEAHHNAILSATNMTWLFRDGTRTYGIRCQD